MKGTFKNEDLVRLGRRRNYFPGRLACWMFLAGFYKIWPINHIVWEISK